MLQMIVMHRREMFRAAPRARTERRVPRMPAGALVGVGRRWTGMVLLRHILRTVDAGLPPAVVELRDGNRRAPADTDDQPAHRARLALERIDTTCRQRR